MNNSENLNVAALSDLVEQSTEETEKINVKEERKKAKLILLSLSGTSKWHILQDYLIEIQADGRLKEGLGQKFPSYKDQLILVHKKIEVEFAEDDKNRQILLDYVTNEKTLQTWTKIPGWNEAVIDKMKTYSLFTPKNRAAVINALKNKAVDEGDVQAAKVWLTMSGDYSDKVEVNDQKFEKYKEYANTLSSSSGVKITDDK